MLWRISFNNLSGVALVGVSDIHATPYNVFGSRMEEEQITSLILMRTYLIPFSLFSQLFKKQRPPFHLRRLPMKLK